MAMILPSEFDVHVSKRRGTNGRPDQFTIGVWDGVLTVKSVCHILPIDEALVALRQLLESAGQVTGQNCSVNGTGRGPHTPSRLP
jgi:hypothetical protein